MLSRKLILGHDDALAVLEALARKGIVGPASGADPQSRPVLMPAAQLHQALELVRDLGDPVAEYLTTPNPSPDLAIDPHDPIDTATTLTWERPPAAEPVGPAQARALLQDWIRARIATGQPTFAIKDLRDIREQTGYGRAWAYKVCAELTDAGVLRKDGDASLFEIVDPTALGTLSAAPA